MNEIAAYIQAGVLGLVQGLTEFLPISSSGHLVVVREILGWPDQGIFFDMVMHFATLFAVVAYFWSDWVSLITAFMSRKTSPKDRYENKRLAGLILLANIPTVIGAWLLMDFVEGPARNPIFVATLILGVGLLFILLEKISRPKRDLSRFNIYDAISIGFGQLAAIVPGVSRSGATIMAGMYQGLKREAAAKVSFMIGAPAILLAGGYSLLKMIGSPLPDTNWLAIAIAFIAAFVSGYLAIRFMLSYLKSKSLMVFAYYRIGLGIVLLVIQLFHVKLPWVH